MKITVLVRSAKVRAVRKISVRLKFVAGIEEKNVLRHIMMGASHCDVNDFAMLCGYKQECSKKYFMDASDDTSCFSDGTIRFFQEKRKAASSAWSSAGCRCRTQETSTASRKVMSPYENVALLKVTYAGELKACRHNGVRHSMDMLKNRIRLNRLTKKRLRGKAGRSEHGTCVFSGRRVFVTGHTGFKGSWMCRVLVGAGAEVTGYSLPAPTEPNLFSPADIEGKMTSIIGDIRDHSSLKRAFDEARPDIVIHLAAQPIVRDSYKDPRYTYETNVMGTVNLLECVRLSSCVKSVLNVTTDKVYHNNEWCWGYRENEPLDGFDPYSNSKRCSELVTHGYRNSFFADGTLPISTARAGNVIGGGDFANDRIIPDCVRAQQEGRGIGVRNPFSIRPYQHVLEPVMACLLIVQRQWEHPGLAGWYNVGPDECDCVTTGELVDLFCERWGEGVRWESQVEAGAPHEAGFLKLDCTKIKTTFGWSPRWPIEEAVEKNCAWSKAWLAEDDLPALMDEQIREYLNSRNGTRALSC